MENLINDLEWLNARSAYPVWAETDRSYHFVNGNDNEYNCVFASLINIGDHPLEDFNLFLSDRPLSARVPVDYGMPKTVPVIIHAFLREHPESLVVFNHHSSDEGMKRLHAYLRWSNRYLDNMQGFGFRMFTGDDKEGHPYHFVIFYSKECQDIDDLLEFIEDQKEEISSICFEQYHAACNILNQSV